MRLQVQAIDFFPLVNTNSVYSALNSSFPRRACVRVAAQPCSAVIAARLYKAGVKLQHVHLNGHTSGTIVRY